MAITLGKIAEALGGRLTGNPDQIISAVAGIENAVPGQISFVATPKYAKFISTTNASALIVGESVETTRSDLSYIHSTDPYTAFVTALRLFAPEQVKPVPGVHPSAVVSAGALLSAEVTIGPLAVLESGCNIGRGSHIMAGVYIGANVSIGENVVIHPNVTVYDSMVIGSNVIIHSGAVIGADGFGFVQDQNGVWEKIPQSGIVVIEDSVEIGANTTIDRATMGETRICRGVKLDNQVHIAHNVVLGTNTVIAAQTGIAGSTRIGQGNMIAGQVGIVGHVETAENVIIEPQSGVSKSIRKPGRYFGHPAKEHEVALRQEAALRQLPDLLQELRELRNRLDQLEPLT